MTQQANDSFIQDEIIHAQRVAKDLEGRVAEFEEEYNVDMEKHEK